MSLPAQVFEEFPVTCMVLLTIVILAIVYVIVKRKIHVDVGGKEIVISDTEEAATAPAPVQVKE